MTEIVIAENQLLKDKWQQLKETITEIKENNEFEGNGDANLGATEICKFLLKYMSVLESEDKQ